MKRDNILLCMLALLTVFGVSYSIFNSKLFRITSINIEEPNWDIFLTSASSQTINKSTSNSMKFQLDNTSETYNITIKNNGNINALLKDIVTTPDLDKIDYIDYQINGIKEGNIISKGESRDVTITFHNPKKQSKEVIVTFNFAQSNITIYEDTSNIYKVGDKVKLKDKTDWYVIDDSNTNYITLFSSESIKDIIFDEKSNLYTNSYIYNYLNKNYKSLLNKANILIGSEGEIRLLTKNEYNKLSKLEINNDNFWLNYNNQAYIVTNEGKIEKQDVNKLSGLRPVIKILKENLIN